MMAAEIFMIIIIILVGFVYIILPISWIFKVFGIIPLLLLAIGNYSVNKKNNKKY